MLASTLQRRGYDLGNPAVVDLLKHIIADALPERVAGRTDEQVAACVSACAACLGVGREGEGRVHCTRATYAFMCWAGDRVWCS